LKVATAESNHCKRNALAFKVPIDGLRCQIP
jgi:hypothetical protein